jgi:hypothetical protein
MLDNLFDVYFEFSVHLFWTHACLSRHFLNNANYLCKDFWPTFLHECHQIFDLLLFRLIDDHFISLFHEKVKLLSQLAMIQKSVIDLNEAIILIFGLFILSKEFSNVFVSLQIFNFKLFKPFFGLLDADLLHMEKVV